MPARSAIALKDTLLVAMTGKQICHITCAVFAAADAIRAAIIRVFGWSWFADNLDTVLLLLTALMWYCDSSTDRTLFLSITAGCSHHQTRHAIAYYFLLQPLSAAIATTSQMLTEESWYCIKLSQTLNLKKKTVSLRSVNGMPLGSWKFETKNDI